MEDTLAKAKLSLRQNFEKGTTCPCCGQFVKRYSRTLNTGSCYSLILIHKLTKETEPEGGFIHVQQEFARHYKRLATGMDYIQLHRWGLIEPKVNNTNTKTRDSGYWRITSKGDLFVTDKILLPRSVYIYNNKTIGFSEELISIKEGLGNKFDYSELMGYTPKERSISFMDPVTGQRI